MFFKKKTFSILFVLLAVFLSLPSGLEAQGNSVKKRADFRSDRLYGRYMKSTLKPGARVRMLVDYENLKAGMTGTYYGPGKAGNPPCPILWDQDVEGTPNEENLPEGFPKEQLSHVYYVDWHMIEAFQQGESRQAVKRQDFVSDEAYGRYMKSMLKPGDRVRAIVSYGKIETGDEGYYYGPAKGGKPPCPILWDEDLDATPNESNLPDEFPSGKGSHVYYIDWHMMELVEGESLTAPVTDEIKTRADFDSDAAYGEYVQATLQPGDRVRAIAGYQSVSLGDEGYYYGPAKGGRPPCPILWDEDKGANPNVKNLPGGFPKDQLSHVYYVDWHLLQIIRSGPSGKKL